MSNAASNPMRTSYLSSGVVLASISLVLIGGGVLIWSNQHATNPSSAEFAQLPDGGPLASTPRVLPVPIDEFAKPRTSQLHGVTYAVENGTAIVKIKVVADGDELIVDASTGRLIESRPSRPSAPPAMGKFAAPFVPMM